MTQHHSSGDADTALGGVSEGLTMAGRPGMLREAIEGVGLPWRVVAKMSVCLESTSSGRRERVHTDPGCASHEGESRAVFGDLGYFDAQNWLCGLCAQPEQVFARAGIGLHRPLSLAVEEAREATALCERWSQHPVVAGHESSWRVAARHVREVVARWCNSLVGGGVVWGQAAAGADALDAAVDASLAASGELAVWAKRRAVGRALGGRWDEWTMTRPAWVGESEHGEARWWALLETHGAYRLAGQGEVVWLAPPLELLAPTLEWVSAQGPAHESLVAVVGTSDQVMWVDRVEADLLEALARAAGWSMARGGGGGTPAVAVAARLIGDGYRPTDALVLAGGAMAPRRSNEG